MSESNQFNNDKGFETKGLYIQFSGDSDVGIQDATWTVSGDLIFESVADYEEFKNTLLTAFDLCSDTPLGIETFEEYKEREEWIDEQLTPPPGVELFQELEERFHGTETLEKFSRSIMSELQSTEVLELSKQQIAAKEVLEWLLEDNPGLPEFLEKFA